jgi:hypothetical protein
LIPSPVPGHEVRVSSSSIHEFAIRDIVNAINQVWIGKDVVDGRPRIAEPELILGGHPLWCGSVLRPEAVVLGAV